MKIDYGPEDLTFNIFKELKLMPFMPKLTLISDKASKEANLEQMLEQMERCWERESISLIANSDAEISFLDGQNAEAIKTTLDDQVQVTKTIL